MDVATAMGTSLGSTHFGAAEFGDKRLTDRLVHTADLLVKHPEGSFPTKLSEPADLDGFYNLLAKPAVTHAAVLAAHVSRTLTVMREREGVVLIVHDTTVLDYSGLAIAELGQVGDGHGRGYYCHNSLAMTPQRQVLGLAHQILHVRRDVPKKETRAARRAHPGRESRLWKSASAAIPAAPAGRLWVDVADRGADILEFLDYEEEAGKHYVVRSQHNRKVAVILQGRCREVKLHEYVRSLKARAKQPLEIPAGPGRSARTATVGVAWTTLDLLPPCFKSGEERGVPLRVVALRVWELHPPAGVEPVEWILLTNVPVESAADAWARVAWYACHWVVEEYHKAKKTGCSIEQMQFHSADRLQPAIAVMSVVAVWMLQLRDASRDPEHCRQPATRWAPKLWVEVLSAWRHKEVRLDWTLHEFYMALARLGGHQNRKSDHPPGWLVLWRGWTQLQAMTAGAAIIRAKRC